MYKMDIKLVFQILTFYFLPNALSQVEFQYYHQDQINGYRIEEYPDYGSQPITNFAHQNQFEDHNEYVNNFEECRCSCYTCVDLQPCCRSECVNCVTQQSNVMFVPYVYPIIVNKNDKDASDKNDKETTISTTSTTLTTTTTTKATIKVKATTETTIIQQINNNENEPDHRNYLSDPKISEVETEFIKADIPKTVITDTSKEPHQLVDKNSKYVMTSLRRTKPNWLPKYGIVPIPDQLAEKILLQLRNMKVLHPTRNNLRSMDFLNKYKN